MFTSRKKRRKEKRSHSSEESDNEDQKRKKKKKGKKEEDSDAEMEPVKSRKNQKNGVGNGKAQEITLVDLEEELNLEELMKQKVCLKLYFYIFFHIGFKYLLFIGAFASKTWCLRIFMF